MQSVVAEVEAKKILSDSSYSTPYEILGVVLEEGKISLSDAKAIEGVLINKRNDISSANEILIVRVFAENDDLITEKEFPLNVGDLQNGIQYLNLHEKLAFENVGHLQVYVENRKGEIISNGPGKIIGGTYKGLPMINDWITHAELGNGPGVMNPQDVPPGVNPELVNTSNLEVNYQYNEDYPEIRTKNLLWYRTGAFERESTIYDRDGEDWEEQALPIGNGYMGAMLFGMPGKDHIQFNEETFWAAGYRGVQEPVGPKYVNPEMSEGINGFMNTGNIFVDFELPENPSITNYYRDLNLDEAVSKVQYEYEGVTYKREYFASYPGEVLVFRYTADTPGALHFTVNPVSAHPGSIQVKDGEISIVGNLKDSEPYTGGGQASYRQPSDLEYCTKVKVIPDDGKIIDHYGKVAIEGATGVTVVVTSATDYDPNQFEISPGGKVDIDAKQFKNPGGVDFAIEKAEKRMANVEGKSYEQIKIEHIEDYKKLFDRVSFSLTEDKEVSQVPTDELQESYQKVIKGIKAGEKISYDPSAYQGLDKHLEELHFNYARYLMISSSRETSLPSTLQGKWNQSVAEIWGSTYCININLEMNYWFAGGANLLESGKALISWLNSQTPAGRITARNMYNIKPKSYEVTNEAIVFSDDGVNQKDDVFIMHTKQSINGQTDMTGSRSIQSPGNTAFLMFNLWDLYRTSGDEQLLNNELYPIMRKAANFYTQYMYANRKATSDVENYPRGYYYTTGSGRSPEQGPTQEGVKYDLQLVAGLFDYVIEAAKILETDQEKVAAWTEIRNHLEVPVELGSDNQIKEWEQEVSYNTDADGKALGDPYHRHISHLVGLYPGTLISRETPEFLKGAEVVLEKRGDDATGWSLANKFLLWARALDGDKALQLFRYQLAQRTYSNLFDFHAPFQIDGNFGSAAGVMELLMQSQTGVIQILPALPKVWDKGHISGIRTKTGAEVSFWWSDNKAEEVQITPVRDGEVKLGYDMSESIWVSSGKDFSIIEEEEGIFTINDARAGVPLRIRFSPGN